MASETAENYLYVIVKNSNFQTLKALLQEIQGDDENTCDYLLKNCRNVVELETFLKDYSYLFMVENGRVAISTDELESGRQNADRYFEEKLKGYGSSLKIEDFRKHLDNAPSDVKHFMDVFYPPKDFRRYLQFRPHIFAVNKKSGTVSHIQRESVSYFQQELKMAGEGIKFMSLRGHIGQAPPCVMKYINAQYPGTEFRNFLENNGHAFMVKDNAAVHCISNMVEIEALTFISDRLTDKVMLVDEVLSEISQAPRHIKRYLKQQCKTVEEMEEFLENHSEHFMVENRRVAVYDSLLEAGRSKAVSYFKEELSSYDERPNCMNFRGHVGQATDDVIDFINCFYPGEEFKAFLEGYPDVFVVFDDDTVDLVEEESVDFFEKCLNDYGDGYFFMNLRGHVSQAPQHVMNYINRSYPGKTFLKFLENNSDVFNVQNGYVYLTPDW